MAKAATISETVQTGVELSLSLNEAQVIRHLLREASGSGALGILTELRDALDGAGVTYSERDFQTKGHIYF